MDHATISPITGGERQNQRLIIGLSTALLTLCFLTFFLRIMARRLMKLSFGGDDWSMVAVLFVCTCMTTSDLVGIRYGSGIHAAKLVESDILNFQINLYVFMLLWVLGTTLVRVSILLFYWRVFAVSHFRKAVLGTGIGIISAGIALLFVFAFQCTPASRFWDEANTAGTCVDQHSFYLSSGAINLLEDAVILALPMPMLWVLKASTGKKVALSFLFALGGFVCITSIFRIIAVGKIIPTDFTFTNLEGGLWSTIEVEVGCICANLPHLRPLVMKYFPRSWRFGTNTDELSSNQYGSKGAFRSEHGFRSKVRPEGFERIHDPKSAEQQSKAVDESGDNDNDSMSTLPEEIEMNQRPHGGIKVQTKMTQSVERAADFDFTIGTNIGTHVTGPQSPTGRRSPSLP